MDAGALIVDLDGTVWDSRPWYASILADISSMSQKEVLTELDVRPLPTVIDRIPGVGRRGFLLAMVDRVDTLVIYEGVEETLIHLQAAAVPMAVATNLPGWIAQRMLDLTGLERFFGAVSHASNGPRKPSRAVTENLLMELGESAAPDRVVVVGDDQNDADLATNSDARFAWAAYGYGGLPENPPHRLLNQFPDLLAL